MPTVKLISCSEFCEQNTTNKARKASLFPCSDLLFSDYYFLKFILLSITAVWNSNHKITRPQSGEPDLWNHNLCARAVSEIKKVILLRASSASNCLKTLHTPMNIIISVWWSSAALQVPPPISCSLQQKQPWYSNTCKQAAENWANMWIFCCWTEAQHKSLVSVVDAINIKLKPAAGGPQRHTKRKTTCKSVKYSSQLL